MSAETLKGFVFPGQGTQKNIPEMAGKLLSHNDSDVARISSRVYQEADDTLRIRLKKLSLAGPIEKLNKPGYAEPAILTLSIALLRILRQRGIKPDVVAGHSLGEFSALVAAEALSFEQALKLARARGQFMEEAGRQNPGKMSAVFGLSLAEVEEICGIAGAEVANINAPGQIVISGRVDSVLYANRIVSERGRKSRILEVSIASHSSLMKPAQEGMAREVRDLPISDLSFPLVMNLTANYAMNTEQVRGEMVDQPTGRVLWLDSVALMSADGVGSYVELGPGDVLAGTIRRIDPNALVSHAMDLIQRQ